MKRLFLIWMVFLISACGVPEVATIAPTPEAIHVSYPQALQAWADRFSNCASSDPLVALYYNQSPSLDRHIFSNEVVLILGEPEQTGPASYLAEIGREQLAVIVNAENAESQFSSEQLRSIFSGRVLNWESDLDKPIQVWVFPDGDPARGIFDRVVIPSGSITSQAMLAPDPGVMLEAIAGDADAIGYLPASILASGNPTLVGNVKVIQVDESLELELDQPVIAVTTNEPQGLLRSMLVCLQAPSP
ncbi:MAG: hypothetical protein A2136_01315 [Chloroflexi bacterium RBG_16_54_11]|nr:MAG: hypothetical protein A2136_01315 [Chloroflexi bacterium RBG_16_54_11]